jgi:hypothetical protein
MMRLLTSLTDGPRISNQLRSRRRRLLLLRSSTRYLTYNRNRPEILILLLTAHNLVTEISSVNPDGISTIYLRVLSNGINPLRTSKKRAEKVHLALYYCGSETLLI